MIVSSATGIVPPPITPSGTPSSYIGVVPPPYSASGLPSSSYEGVPPPVMSIYVQSSPTGVVPPPITPSSSPSGYSIVPPPITPSSSCSTTPTIIGTGTGGVTPTSSGPGMAITGAAGHFSNNIERVVLAAGAAAVLFV